jgi:hypothetical protein
MAMVANISNSRNKNSQDRLYRFVMACEVYVPRCSSKYYKSERSLVEWVKQFKANPIRLIVQSILTNSPFQEDSSAPDRSIFS